MAVEHRPVDEEQSLLAAGPVALTEVRRTRRERLPLRDVGVPEDVVRHERGAGAVDDPRAARRERVEELAQLSLEETAEDGIARDLERGRAPDDLVPGRVRVAQVEPLEGKLVPGNGRRAVDRDDELARGVGPASLDLAADDRVGRERVVAHGSRSSVSAALHENDRLPSGSPVRGS